MTNYSLINASGKTHAKIAFLALAMSAVFLAVVSASKSDVRASAQVVKAGATVQIAASDRALVR